MENLKYIIESLLFVSDTPIMLKQIHYIMPDVPMSQIRKAVQELTLEYNERGGSFYLSNVAGGIQLRTRPMYKDWIKRFIRSRPMRLSRAALEALAIVAYKQPVTRSEVDKIRGVDSGAIMRTLVENRLIRIIGRKEVAGRPMLYTTSKRFLEVFDLNDLKDLPAPDDLEIDDADAMEKVDSNAENDAKIAEKDESNNENNALTDNRGENDSQDSENNETDKSADQEDAPVDNKHENDSAIVNEVLRTADNETADNEVGRTDNHLKDDEQHIKQEASSFGTSKDPVENNGDTYDKLDNSLSDDIKLPEDTDENDEALEMPVNIRQDRRD